MWLLGYLGWLLWCLGWLLGCCYAVARVPWVAVAKVLCVVAKVLLGYLGLVAMLLEASRNGTPHRKRTNKDNFRCLITIWNIGVASRGLNELIFVKTSNSTKIDIFHYFCV